MPFRVPVALSIAVVMSACGAPASAPTPDPSVIAAAVASALAAERARAASPAVPTSHPPGSATPSATAATQAATQAPATVAVTAAPTVVATAAPTIAATLRPAAAATAAPTAAPAAPTPAPATPTPAPADPCPSTGDPAATGIEGRVYYGNVGAAGVLLQVGRWESGFGPVIATGTTDGTGRYRILGVPAGINAYVSVVQPQDLYATGAAGVATYPIRTCGGMTVDVSPTNPNSWRVFRLITGINYPQGATVPRGATLTWNAVPGATSYCIETGGSLTVMPTTTCPGYNNGFIVTTPSFTLPGDAASPDRQIALSIRAFEGANYIGFLKGGLFPCCDGYYRYTIAP